MSDIVERLLGPSNWLRQEKGSSWKDDVSNYDTAPFDAAREIVVLRDRVSILEAALREADDALEANKEAWMNAADAVQHEHSSLAVLFNTRADKANTARARIKEVLTS